MVKKTQRAWFEVWGEEMAQNRILKGFLLFFIVVCSLQAVAIALMSQRKVAVVAVSNSDSRALSADFEGQEILQKEAIRVLSQYAQAHLTWEFSTIERGFELAAKHIHPDFEKDFKKANQEQIRIAKEKKLSQTFYTSELNIDLKSNSALLKGDRILIVEGLRATNPLVLELKYIYGARTESNPEGIYVASEKLVQ